ncbi:uncharacterized protein LOC123877868 [Maniola jurtina]|uniref:uncharacterized protein LOC123877868 n=1 Tax=Maniola jurtina TaxID=191418 RepID=UPI001E68D6CA|nr:uncharacterized protein LOC123877868 [Maniola jurtina]
MIRDSYTRYRKKNKAGTGSAAAKNAKDKRYKQLSFLDNIPEHRSGGTNIIASPSNVTDNEDSVDSDHLERESQNQDTEETETSLVLNETPIKVKRLKHSDDNIIKIWKERNEKRQDLMKTIIQRKDDDVQLFCNYIGNVLRSLPPLQKAEAKRHISSVVSDYEILAARITTGTERSDTLSSSYTSSPEGSESSTNVSPGPRDTHHLSILGQSPVQHITDPYSPIADVQSPGHVSSPEPTALRTSNQDTDDSLQDFFNL